MMKIGVRILTAGLLVMADASSAQSPMVPYTTIPGPMIPGLSGPMVPNSPGTPAPPPVGCVSSGSLDLSNVCNDIYILTGMF